MSPEGWRSSLTQSSRSTRTALQCRTSSQCNVEVEERKGRVVSVYVWKPEHPTQELFCSELVSAAFCVACMSVAHPRPVPHTRHTVIESRSPPFLLFPQQTSQLFMEVFRMPLSTCRAEKKFAMVVWL
ncbi:unnamed protein product [Scytosiphon promiscuus]